MNYNYLLYFSVPAKTEHYTTAAARPGISRPALSSAIHNLENAMGGVKLFEKVGRNIRLTEAGHFYSQSVEEAITKLHSASVLLRDSKTQAPVVIRLGVVSGTLDGLLSREIVTYTRNNKRIRFHLTESSSENLMDPVRQEKLDMAIVDSSNRDRSLHLTNRIGLPAIFQAFLTHTPNLLHKITRTYYMPNYLRSMLLAITARRALCSDTPKTPRDLHRS